MAIESIVGDEVSRLSPKQSLSASSSTTHSGCICNSESALAGRVETTSCEGATAQPAEDAILECRGRTETERLLEAAKQAGREGLLTTAEWQRARKRLRS